jgi:hypothetical protein
MVAMQDRRSAAEWPPLGSYGHSVQFYESDGDLLEGLQRLIGGALLGGEAAIVIATEAHRRDLAQRLTGSGLDLSSLSREGRYMALDAAETLVPFMDGEAPDAVRFFELASELIEHCAEPMLGMRRRHIVISVEGRKPAEIVAGLLTASGRRQAPAPRSASRASGQGHHIRHPPAAV